MAKIPETKELLNKSRLPLGVLIHPFRDINVSNSHAPSVCLCFRASRSYRPLVPQKLPVIQCSEIVRCRSCRTYINPFVYFVDSMKWKCNLCYRVNECEFSVPPNANRSGRIC